MKLALGTAQFGLSYGIANRTGQVPQIEVGKMLSLAGDHGIDTLDTAIAYGGSEAVLGRANVERFHVVTKLPSLPSGCDVRGWVREQVAASLDRLQLTSLYAVLLHCPNDLLGNLGNELFAALQAVKDSGEVWKIGISIYSPDELEAVIKAYSMDLVQAPFNLVDRRLQTSGWLRRLKDMGAEVHARSPFLQGLLLMPEVPATFTRWAHIWDKWHSWCAEHQISPVRASLAFPLGFQEIDRVVVGADGERQLREILEAVSSPLPDNLPDLSCDDVDLVNPSHWGK